MKSNRQRDVQLLVECKQRMHAVKTYVRMLSLLCVCSVIIASLSACGNKAIEEVPELLEPVTAISSTVTCEKKDICNTQIIRAQAIPYTEEMSFSTSGIIETINYNVGDKVKKGDVLAELAGARDSALLADANNDITEAENNNEELNLIAEYDIRIMEAELADLYGKEKEMKEIDIKIAKEKLESDKRLQQIDMDELIRTRDNVMKDLDKCLLISSMDGVVSCISKEVGDMVEQGTFIMSVSDDNNVIVKSDYVSSRDISKADDYYVSHNGKRYDVVQQEADATEINSLKEEDLPIYSYYDLNSYNPDFKAGDYLELIIESGKTEDALVLPSNAVYNESDDVYVYKDENGNKIKTDVTIGTVTASYIQIKNGLKEGDVVYVKP